jgi:hypothetical protein
VGFDYKRQSKKKILVENQQGAIKKWRERKSGLKKIFEL